MAYNILRDSRYGGKERKPRIPKRSQDGLSLGHVLILKPVTGAPDSSLEHAPPAGAGDSSAPPEPGALGVGKVRFPKEVSRCSYRKERNDHRQAATADGHSDIGNP